MDIKNITIRCSLSKNYNKYEVELSASLDTEDDFNANYESLKDKIKELTLDGLEEICLLNASGEEKTIKEKSKYKTYNGLKIANNIDYSTTAVASDGLRYVYTKDKNGRNMWFNKDKDGNCHRIFIDEFIGD